MSYVESVLGKDEKVFYAAEVSLIPYLLKLFIGAVLFFSGLVYLSISSLFGVLVFTGLIIFAAPFITKYSTELVITNKRIIAKFGFIRRHTIELNLSKIESIRVQQGITARIFNYGDLEIVGTGGTREPIPGIVNPLMFRRKFDEILSL